MQMESLIPVVNKLQDVFGAIGHQSIDLPQIVVVGSQSAGKSSVLENIVGRDFLPRGSGVVTRRPLVLQLYCVGGGDVPVERPATGTGEEWGEFLHLPGQRFYDFNEIREEISRETERISGRNKGISNKSINLKIYSPHVLNLTLVDLPGITKVPTGDQPEDIEEQIRNMCLEFISNPNAVILAVSAANSDLVNSDGLKMARAVDPDGDRTIGVLTKVDIMDAGTDCADILANRVVPLRRGYIAVVNRSQKDIQDSVPIRQGIAKEQSYFQAHPKYRHLMSKCGTTNLARTLNQILMMHIRDCLPDIKSKISMMMAEVQTNIDALGDSVDAQGNSRLGAMLLKVLSSFVESFCSSVDGKGSAIKAMEVNELYGGARIAFIFKEIFGKSLKSMDPFDGLDDDDIRTAIANASGPRPSLFVSEFSFDLLVRRQIAKLEQPGLQCVDLVFDEMQRMAYQSESVEFSRFPELRDRVYEVVHQLLRSCVQPTQRMISNLVQIELAYINTAHPDFIGGKLALGKVPKKEQTSSSVVAVPAANGGAVESSGACASNASNGQVVAPTRPSSTQVSGGGVASSGSAPSTSTAAGSIFSLFSAGSKDLSKGAGGSTKAVIAPDPSPVVKLPPVPDKMRSQQSSVTDRELIETEIIKNLISSYFDIVKKNFMDLVPKTIMHFLVNNFKNSLQNELVTQLYKEQMMADLMRETEDVASRRKQCKDMKELLRRAIDIVNEVRDFNTFK